MNILRELLQSLYLVRLKNFEWIGHLHQIQGNWAGTNFVTESRVNSRSLPMQECRDESEIYNWQRIQLSNNIFINGILGTHDLAWLEYNFLAYVRVIYEKIPDASSLERTLRAWHDPHWEGKTYYLSLPDTKLWLLALSSLSKGFSVIFSGSL